MHQRTIYLSRWLIALFSLLFTVAVHSSVATSKNLTSQQIDEVTCEVDNSCNSSLDLKANTEATAGIHTTDPNAEAKLKIEQNVLQKTVESTIATDKEKLEIVKERLDEMEKRHMENIDHIVSQFDDQFNTEFDTLTLDNQFVKDIDATLKSSPNQPQILNDFKGSGLYIAGYPIEAVAAVVLPPLLYILWYLTRRMLGKS